MAVSQLKYGAALSYVTIILHIVIGLMYTPYMLRMLGQSEYGIYSLAASIIAYLTVLDLGFGNAIIRYTSKFRAEGKVKEQQEMFGMFLLLYSIIGLVAFICGTVFSLNVENLFVHKFTPTELMRTKIIMWIMTCNLAITFPMSIWGSIMSAYEQFIFQRIIGIVRTILNPIVMVLLLVYGYKAIAMVIVTTIFNVVTLALNYWYCKRHLQIKFLFGRFKWGFIKEVTIYSFWIFLNAIMDRIYWSTGQFVLGIFQGAAAISVYAIAIQLQSMYMQFSTAISGVFLPRITSIVTTGNNEKQISDLFVRTGRLQFIILSYILTVFVIFGRAFIQIWAGTAYIDAYIICLLFFVPLTVPLIQNLGISILQARNQMAFRSTLYIVIALLSLVISIPLAKTFGSIGCAVGTALALIVGQIVIMNIYYAKKQHLNISLFWTEIMKMSIVPLAFIALGFYTINHFNLILLEIPIFIGCAIVFTILYICAFWVFSMNQYERDIFSSPILRLIHRFK